MQRWHFAWGRDYFGCPNVWSITRFSDNGDICYCKFASHKCKCCGSNTTSTIISKYIQNKCNYEIYCKYCTSYCERYNSPDKPRINSPIPGTYTNNENIPIIGTAEALSKVQVYQDERKLGESIAENGTWIYDLHEEFVEGVVNISADAIDKAGNLSEKSDIVSFSLDKTIPFVELAKLEVFAKDGCESCSIYSIRVPVGDNMKLEKIAAT